MSACPSDRPQEFCDFLICINLQSGGPASQCRVISTPVESSQDYMSIFIYVYLSVSLFGDHKSAARNCAQHMQPQDMGSNNLRESIICLFIRPYGRPQAFCDFGICINFQCGGPASRCIYKDKHQMK